MDYNNYNNIKILNNLILSNKLGIQGDGSINYGTSGQVLISNGDVGPPTWTDTGTGTGTGTGTENIWSTFSDEYRVANGIGNISSGTTVKTLKEQNQTFKDLLEAIFSLERIPKLNITINNHDVYITNSIFKARFGEPYTNMHFQLNFNRGLVNNAFEITGTSKITNLRGFDPPKSVLILKRPVNHSPTGNTTYLNISENISISIDITNVNAFSTQLIKYIYTINDNDHFFNEIDIWYYEYKFNILEQTEFISTQQEVYHNAPHNDPDNVQRFPQLFSQDRTLSRQISIYKPVFLKVNGQLTELTDQDFIKQHPNDNSNNNTREVYYDTKTIYINGMSINMNNMGNEIYIPLNEFTNAANIKLFAMDNFITKKFVEYTGSISREVLSENLIYNNIDYGKYFLITFPITDLIGPNDYKITLN